MDPHAGMPRQWLQGMPRPVPRGTRMVSAWVHAPRRVCGQRNTRDASSFARRCTVGCGSGWDGASTQTHCVHMGTGPPGYSCQTVVWWGIGVCTGCTSDARVDKHTNTTTHPFHVGASNPCIVVQLGIATSRLFPRVGKWANCPVMSVPLGARQYLCVDEAYMRLSDTGSGTHQSDYCCAMSPCAGQGRVVSPNRKTVQAPPHNQSEGWQCKHNGRNTRRKRRPKRKCTCLSAHLHVQHAKVVGGKQRVVLVRGVDCGHLCRCDKGWVQQPHQVRSHCFLLTST